MTDLGTATVLAIDSSTSVLRMALGFGGDRIVQSSEDVKRSHGMVLMRRIENLLSSSEQRKEDLQALVICTGPGSFTGLRVGLAAAKGMAMALDIPVVGVNLFEIAVSQLIPTQQEAMVVVPFKRDEVFVGLFAGSTIETTDVRAVAIADLSQHIGDHRALAVGFDLVELWPQARPTALGTALMYEAAHVLRIGVEKLSDGDIPQLAALEPAYMQKSQAEIRFEEHQRKNRQG